MATILNASTSSGLVTSADTSGDLELQSNGTTKLTVSSTGVTATSIQGTIVQGTAVDSTSGTSIDFTGIPSWAKRITVMLSGISTNGSTAYLLQIGSGSVTTSGYNSQAWSSGSSSGVITTGFVLSNTASAGDAWTGVYTLNLISSNTWVGSGNLAYTISSSTGFSSCGSSPNLSGALDRIRITTASGTATYDAGTINIQYEG